MRLPRHLRTLAIFLSMLVPAVVVASVVRDLHTFEPGDPVSSMQVNENFSSLAGAIETHAQNGDNPHGLSAADLGVTPFFIHRSTTPESATIMVIPYAEIGKGATQDNLMVSAVAIHSNATIWARPDTWSLTPSGVEVNWTNKNNPNLNGRAIKLLCSVH